MSRPIDTVLLANAVIALGSASAAGVMGFLIDRSVPAPTTRAARLRRGLARRALRTLVICALLLGLMALYAAL